MTTVLITNAYSSRNRGDAAIVLGMIESLRRTEELAGAEIVVSSADPVEDAQAYGVRVAPSFQSLGSGLSSRPMIGRLWFVLFALPLSLFWAGSRRFLGIDFRVGRRLRTLFRTYAAADLVVAAGGGYLYTNSVTRGNFVLLGQVYAFLFGRILGKPVVLFAQSIGPFAGRWQAWFVGRALRMTNMVQVRESISRDLVLKMKLEVPVFQLPDAAFLLEARAPDHGADLMDLSDGGPSVGLTVRRWFRVESRQQAFEEEMAAFVRWLVDRRGMRVFFMPQVTASDLGDDDRTAAERIEILAGPSDRIRVIKDELPAPCVKWLCGKMDFFVGTRMHSNIFALSSGVPTLAIAYQPKTEGIMSELGLEECVVPIEGLVLEKLQRTFDGLVNRRSEIRDVLEATIREMKDKALDGGRLVADTFETWRGDRGNGRPRRS